NLTGEKVTPQQLALALVACGYRGEFAATAVPAERPRVDVAVVAPIEAAAFDRALRDVNLEYSRRRDLGRLGLPRVTVVAATAFAAFRATSPAAPAQVKDPQIVSPEAFGALTTAR